MGSAGPNTVFPRWAIGLIVGGVLLVAAIIFAILMCKKNQDEDKGENFDQILKQLDSNTVMEETFFKPILKPPESSLVDTSDLEEKPLFERIEISSLNKCFSPHMDSFLYCMRRISEPVSIYKLVNFLPGISSYKFTPDDISVVCAGDISKKDVLISGKIKEKIVVELNKLKDFIFENRRNLNKDVTKEVDECIKTINDFGTESYERHSHVVV